MLLKGVPTHFELYPGTPIALSNVIHLFSDHVCAACAAGLVLIELQEQIVAANCGSTWYDHACRSTDQLCHGLGQAAEQKDGGHSHLEGS
jgi:hypothetical protein